MEWYLFIFSVIFLTYNIFIIFFNWTSIHFRLGVLSISMSDIIDAYFIFCCYNEIKETTEESKSMLSNKAYINRKRYQFVVLWERYEWHFQIYFAFFRDNGISIQITLYQLYCEIFMFLFVIIFIILPFDTNILSQRIAELIYTFMFFVVQPLFYLNGDVNFR